MKHRMFFGVLVLIVFALPRELAWSLAPTTNASALQNSTCAVPKEEFEIPTRFLKAKAIPGVTTVLVTEPDANDVDIDKISEMLAIRKRELSNDLRADFKAKNESGCLIGHFGGIKDLKFISKAEKQRLLGAGPEEFHKEYGKNAQLVTISRVGFNSDKSLGLLHVATSFTNKAGEGITYLLERRNNKWGIAAQVETGISERSVS